MYEEHLRTKAIELRQHYHLSLDEIVERLGLSRTTVYYWIKDIPLGRSKKPNHLRASEVNRENAKKKRDDAYQQGLAEYPMLIQEPTFRDFVVLYMAEGYRRNRNTVSIANSNPRIIQLGYYWIAILSKNKLQFSVQIHTDNDEKEIKSFWATLLSISPASIRTLRKSNSGQLSGRQWRSIHGVFTVAVGDTYFRSRLQAWMDKIQEEWYTHVSEIGV
jgi:transcriptional regulator with XRE-family HTH domain